MAVVLGQLGADELADDLKALAGRPVTLHSFPRGIQAPGHYRRELPQNAPDRCKRPLRALQNPLSFCIDRQFVGATL